LSRKGQGLVAAKNKKPERRLRLGEC
jgi:hypothetical protein